MFLERSVVMRSGKFACTSADVRGKVLSKEVRLTKGRGLTVAASICMWRAGIDTHRCGVMQPVMLEMGRPVGGEWGFEGVRSNPAFGLHYTPPSRIHFKCPTDCNWSRLASLPSLSIQASAAAL